MKHKSLSKVLLFVSAVFALLLAGCGGDSASDPIKIAINEWTGQHVTAHVLGNMFEEAGFTVEYVTAGAVPQFAAIADGDIHVQPEVWTNNVGDIYPDAVADGRIEELGLLELGNAEGWMYPLYMEDDCPGLPSMQALIDCKDLLATAETGENGRIIAYPADWGTRTVDTVAALGLPFDAIPAGSEGAMTAEIQAAAAAGDPFVMMFWAPHWIHTEVEMGVIEIDPAYDPACLEDAGWGPNADATYDCGFEQARVTKAATGSFKDNFPEAYGILQSFSLDGVEQSKMVVEIDVNGRDIEEVVDEWLANQ